MRRLAENKGGYPDGFLAREAGKVGGRSPFFVAGQTAMLEASHRFQPHSPLYNPKA